MRTMTLPRPTGFDLAAVVTSHGWYRLAPFEWDPRREILHHTDDFDGAAATSAIRQSGRRLTITATPSVERNELLRLVRRMLQLDVDLSEFHSRCAETRGWEEIPSLGLGRLLCAPTLFEDTVKIILTTNTRWARTIEMNRRLVETFGRGNAFPTPSDLATASELDLRDHARVGYRGRSIHQLAGRFASGEIDLTTRPEPSSADYQELYEWYLRLPGIGPYGAAHLTAMDGRHDRIAVDTEFRTWARKKYHGGRKVKDETLLRHYRSWGRWQYIAYWCEMTVDSSKFKVHSSK